MVIYMCIHLLKYKNFLSIKKKKYILQEIYKVNYEMEKKKYILYYIIL